MEALSKPTHNEIYAPMTDADKHPENMTPTEVKMFIDQDAITVPESFYQKMLCLSMNIIGCDNKPFTISATKLWQRTPLEMISLPEELICVIVYKLPITDICNFYCTCKKLNQLSVHMLSIPLARSTYEKVNKKISNHVREDFPLSISGHIQDFKEVFFCDDPDLKESIDFKIIVELAHNDNMSLTRKTAETLFKTFDFALQVMLLVDFGGVRELVFPAATLLEESRLSTSQRFSVMAGLEALNKTNGSFFYFWRSIRKMQ